MDFKRPLGGKTFTRLCIVSSAAVAVVLGAALFAGRPGSWTFPFEIAFLTSIVVFLWLLVHLIAQRLQSFTPDSAGETPRPERPAHSTHNR